MFVNNQSKPFTTLHFIESSHNILRSITACIHIIHELFRQFRDQLGDNLLARLVSQLLERHELHDLHIILFFNTHIPRCKLPAITQCLRISVQMLHEVEVVLSDAYDDQRERELGGLDEHARGLYFVHDATIGDDHKNNVFLAVGLLGLFGATTHAKGNARLLNALLQDMLEVGGEGGSGVGHDLSVALQYRVNGVNHRILIIAVEREDWNVELSTV